MPEKPPPLIPPWLTILIVVAVTTVWTASMAADIALGEKYDPSPLVHAAMMVVLGSVLGVQVVRR